MSDTQTLLKALLRSRHLQEHRAFCRAYDRAAKQVDPDLAGRHPSKATLYRWMSGGMVSLPHPDHCRVLEHMFPRCAAETLFSRWDGSWPLPEPPSNAQASPLVGQEVELAHRATYADLTAAYATRAEFVECMPPNSLFDPATRIQTAGLSLNLICQQYSDQRLRALLARGARLECLFLDPDGEATRAREVEEGYMPGDLTSLTRLNVQMLRRLRDELPVEDRERVDLRTYDETIRFNITIIDDAQCVVQPYLPVVRGVDSPTLVMRRCGGGIGMFATFERIFTTLWSGARRCA
ncbi:MAG: DUF5919 domain-containing protein [Pseudonocardia sp.]